MSDNDREDDIFDVVAALRVAGGIKGVTRAVLSDEEATLYAKYVATGMTPVFAYPDADGKAEPLEVVGFSLADEQEGDALVVVPQLQAHEEWPPYVPDPREDCPWKCEKDAYECLCRDGWPGYN